MVGKLITLLALSPEGSEAEGSLVYPELRATFSYSHSQLANYLRRVNFLMAGGDPRAAELFGASVLIPRLTQPGGDARRYGHSQVIGNFPHCPLLDLPAH